MCFFIYDDFLTSVYKDSETCEYMQRLSLSIIHPKYIFKLQYENPHNASYCQPEGARERVSYTLKILEDLRNYLLFTSNISPY